MTILLPCYRQGTYLSYKPQSLQGAGIRDVLRNIGRFIKRAAKVVAPVLGQAALKAAPTVINMGSSYLQNRLKDEKDPLFGRTAAGREIAGSVLNKGTEIGLNLVDKLQKNIDAARVKEKLPSQEAQKLIDGSGILRSNNPQKRGRQAPGKARREFRRIAGRGLTKF